MNELLSTLAWPAAIAILGSVVAVVTGLLALYTSYLKSSSNGKQKMLPPTGLPHPEMLQLHERFSKLRDRVAIVEGQHLVVTTQIENLMRQISEHDVRDMADFKMINAKVDKLMEIIVEMLKDAD